MKRSVLILFAIVLSSPAHGMVYSWSDAAGIKHFSNKEYDIPTRYQAKAKALYPEQAETLAPQQNPLQNAPTPQTMPVEQVKASQPVVTPEPRKIEPEPKVTKGRRNRASRSKED